MASSLGRIRRISIRRNLCSARTHDIIRLNDLLNNRD